MAIDEDAAAPSGAAKDDIAAIVARAAHFLPDQAPLHAFVHHNTLHAFEHLPFKKALEAGARMFGARTLMTEAQFREAIAAGRIRQADLAAVIEAEVEDPDLRLFPGGPTRRQLLAWRLGVPVETPSAETIGWWIHDKALLARAHPLSRSSVTAPGSPIYAAGARELTRVELETLWRRLETASPRRIEKTGAPRLRDLFLEDYNLDTDEWLKPFLIRLCAAYLDQTIAEVEMPGREKGFLAAALDVITTGGVLTEPWLDGVSSQLRRVDPTDPAGVVSRTLSGLGIAPEHWEAAINATLRVLPGWAGMFHKLEREPEKAPVFALNGALLDYLAVVMLLDRAAARAACRRTGARLRDLAPRLSAPREAESPDPDRRVVFEGFVAAQAFDIVRSLLSEEASLRAFAAEIARWSDAERRWLLQLAYERRHRQATLDAMIAHERKGSRAAPAPSLQAVFCMDEREESTRRHLEEVLPYAETFGCAGFFGVAMQYKGLDDVTSRPLCPVVRVPAHFVEEVAADPEAGRAYRAALRRRGLALERAERSERSLLFGAVWSLAAGLVQSAHLVARSLAPRLANRLHHSVLHANLEAPQTRLALFRQGEEKTPDGLYRGYAAEEAAGVVEGLLKSLGLTSGFAPVVAIVGHGSSSLNNPHEAAHDCGATGGGRGGPNARAFAQMANDPDVRALLSARGVEIPAETWFVGGYHNTCDDSMAYYDEDLVPQARRAELAAAKAALAEACRRDAQERCRRFEDAPANLGRRRALEIAQAHAQDLAQPRPEYGHATNAICFIGRRNVTRGLFFDRRAFLISYDPYKDSNGDILASILEAAGPVGAGINLEYYFSFVDPVHFGCGTKLPHNISGLVGVMDGHASDLRTGLPWQMVEIHEPVRLLTIVEATPARLLRIAEEKPVVGALVGNEWIQLIARDPETGAYSRFTGGSFTPHAVEADDLATAPSSDLIYGGARGHLGFAHITAPPLETSDA